MINNGTDFAAVSEMDTLEEIVAELGEERVVTAMKAWARNMSYRKGYGKERRETTKLVMAELKRTGKLDEILGTRVEMGVGKVVGA